MSTFNIPNTFNTGEVIEADEHNDNWVAIKAYAEGVASGLNLDPGAVSTVNLQDGAVSEDKLATNAVGPSRLQNDAVTTDKILDLNVTTGKIADDAVTTAKIAAGAVTATEIGTGAVTSDKILDGTIANVDISGSAAIAYSKLAGVLHNGTSTNALVTVSTSGPTGGSAGDIWFKY